MDPTTIGAIGVILALVLIGLRVPIGFVLGGLAISCTFVFFAWRTGTFLPMRAVGPTISLISSNMFDFVHSYSLSMVPLFIAVGHIAYQADITRRIYDAGRIWLVRIPGGLAMASMMGCGGFSAISGSSMACAAAMGRICVPEMVRSGYNMRLAASTVAVGGTLGSLIPPSILFIIYGLFAEQSVSKLFMAGVLPGLLSLAAFMLVIYIWARRSPEDAPAQHDELMRGDRRRALIGAWPAALLFVVTIGGIYGGIFTATEAAAVCLAFVLIYGAVSRRLTLPGFMQAMRDTAIQTGVIFFIAASAKMFVAFVSLTGLTGHIVTLTEYYELSQWSILLVIVLLYLVMGMFLDPLGIMLLTLPFVIPLVDGMGLDLIWFGVIVVKLLEIGLISPPMGLNVFVISGVVGKDAPVHLVFRGVVMFLVMDLMVLGLLLAFPTISLLLPNTQF